MNLNLQDQAYFGVSNPSHLVKVLTSDEFGGTNLVGNQLMNIRNKFNNALDLSQE